jgi:arthrofactin-type cyclic lipopeptide synthetase C
MVEHRGIVNRLWWMQEAYGLGADDRVLQKTPFSFDVSVWEFFWPLMTGARLVVARPEGHKDPAYLAAVIDEQGVTVLHFVPSMLAGFVDHGSGGEGLSLLFCSGEELPEPLMRRCQARLPDTRIHNLYGPTEASVDVTAWYCGSGDLPAGAASVPIGRPIANTRLYIVDGAMEPVPVGVAGELYIGGAGVARGI